MAVDASLLRTRDDLERRLNAANQAASNARRSNDRSSVERAEREVTELRRQLDDVSTLIRRG